MPPPSTTREPSRERARPAGLWTRVRAVFRIGILAAGTVVGWGSLVAIMPLRRLAPRRHLALRNAFFRWWGRTLGRAMGMRVELEGTPPSGAFFLVANHLGYMDIILLGAHLDAAFVAKADLLAWPLAGRAFAAADTIFVDRSRRRDVVRVMACIESCLSRPLGVVLFPEGTSGCGDRLLPFRPPILDLPARAGKPVSWATIRYRTPPSAPPPSEVVCWWGDAPFLPHLWRLAKLPGFVAELRFGERAVADRDRKALAQRLHAAMSERFVPLD